MERENIKMESIAVLCSGGDAPGMNAALRAVVRTAIFNGMRIYGIHDGYRGLIDNDIEELKVSSVSDIMQRGGTVLGSARSERFRHEEGQQRAYEVLKEHDIDGLIVLGGDGSFKGALDLQEKGMQVIGIPCTIDNDLGYTTYTIGFLTAVETVLDAVGRLRDTSSSHGIGVIVEVMGRHCGDIALFAGLAGGAEAVIVPEVEFDLDELERKITNGEKRGKKHQIIIKAEGVQRTEEICRILEERTGIDFRTTLLGHVQRGGAPSALDRILASRMGSLAVELLVQKKTGVAIATNGSELHYVSMEEAVNTPHKFNTEIYRVMRELSI